MSEEYDFLIDDLRLELQGEQRTREKLEEDLQEAEEEVSTLRTDYNEAREANEKFELSVEEMTHNLAKAKDELRSLRKKKISEIEIEILEENETLKKKLRLSRERYEILLLQMDEEKEAVYEAKQPTPVVINTISAEPDQMQELLEQMVQQYESEIQILRTANEATISGLQDQLENAILDKEEIAESYIIEIERVDLALTEAVNLLSELQRKYNNLKAAGARTPGGVKYRSLSEVKIQTGPKTYINLPLNTEVLCSKVIKRHSAQISEPEKYKGLVDLQSISGKWLFETVDNDDKDDYFQPHDIEIGGGRIDDCKV